MRLPPSRLDLFPTNCFIENSRESDCVFVNKPQTAACVKEPEKQQIIVSILSTVLY